VGGRPVVRVSASTNQASVDSVWLRPCRTRSRARPLKWSTRLRDPNPQSRGESPEASPAVEESVIFDRQAVHRIEYGSATMETKGTADHDVAHSDAAGTRDRPAGSAT
jgi:hypothetical protein